MSLSSFDSPRNTLTWAKEAINELDAICSAFLGTSQNFQEIRQFDADTKENVLKVVAAKKLPHGIARKATEALSNIRHSFDQSVYAACRAIGQTPKDSIYFPWADSPADLEYRLGKVSRPGKQQKIKIPPELWPVLRGFEPYRRSDTYAGGDDLVRELARVANRKHTVALNFRGEVAGIKFPSFSGSMDSGESFRLRMPNWDSVNNEIEIARYPLGIKTDYNYSLNLYVALDESAPLYGVPVSSALGTFLAKAQAVLDVLEQETIKIMGD